MRIMNKKCCADMFLYINECEYDEYWGQLYDIECFSCGSHYDGGFTQFDDAQDEIDRYLQDGLRCQI